MKKTLSAVWGRLHKSDLAGTPYAVKPIHPKAHIPNPPSHKTPQHHIPPTVKPGHGYRVGSPRHLLHMFMLATVGNPYGWTYYEVRPSYLPSRRLLPKELVSVATVKAALMKVVKAFKSDCSWGVKTGHYLCGRADDPTGENWTQWGNSSSTYAHLKKRPGLDNANAPKASDLAKCKVGDIGVVGQDGSEHMWMVMEEGPNPLVWSQGGGNSPNCYRVLDDTRRPISVCIPKGLE